MPAWTGRRRGGTPAVEDAPQVRKALSRVLAATGYQVRAFESAESFLGAQCADAPDIQTSVDAMKAGAVDFLTKPIDSARLFAAIKQASAQRGATSTSLDSACGP
jgi:FixJ family two-component response regulator